MLTKYGSVRDLMRAVAAGRIRPSAVGSVGEAQKLLGLTKQGVSNLIARGVVDAWRVGTHVTFVDLRSVRRRAATRRPRP